jgi:Glycoside Hydrolase Family 113
MKQRLTRSLTIVAGLGVLVGGCAVASRVGALQPPTVASTAHIALPPLSAHWSPGKFQRGIDIDWYTYPNQDVSGDAAATVLYVQSLNANAISISFPFFMRGTRSGSVHATSATPTPAELATLVTDAHEAGLYVSLRPLLDEKSLGRSRVDWKPANEAAWFAAYRRFLAPYAVMAKTTKVQEFIIGTELNEFDVSSRWAALDRFIRNRYNGTIACADSWSRLVTRGCGVRTQTVDAYHPFGKDHWLHGFETWDRSLPKGTVQTEVGIAAAQGAWTKPYKTKWPGSRFEPSVQSRWFTAACTAAFKTHLGGIYFWAVGLSAKQPKGPTKSNLATWTGGLGGRAIAACFKKIAR